MITLTIQLTIELELPHQWMSRCLELDIISAGTTPEHALEAIAEAVRMTVEFEARRRGVATSQVFADIAAEVAARHPMTKIP